MAYYFRLLFHIFGIKDFFVFLEYQKGKCSFLFRNEYLLGFGFPGTERDDFQKNVGQLNLHDFNLNKITCVAFLFLVEGCPVGTSGTTRLVPLTLSSSGFCLLKRPIKESYKASCHFLGFLHLAFIWEHKSKGVCIGRSYRHIGT